MYKKLPHLQKDFPTPQNLKRHQDIFKPANKHLLQPVFDFSKSNRKDTKDESATKK